MKIKQAGGLSTLMSLYVASKDTPSCNFVRFLGFLKVCQTFSLDISCFFTHFQPLLASFLSKTFLTVKVKTITSKLLVLKVVLDTVKSQGALIFCILGLRLS